MPDCRLGEIGQQALRPRRHGRGAAQIALLLGLAAQLIQHDAAPVARPSRGQCAAPGRIGDRVACCRPIRGSRLQRQDVLGEPGRGWLQLSGPLGETPRDRVIPGFERLGQQAA